MSEIPPDVGAGPSCLADTGMCRRSPLSQSINKMKAYFLKNKMLYSSSEKIGLEKCYHYYYERFNVLTINYVNYVYVSMSIFI